MEKEKIHQVKESWSPYCFLPKSLRVFSKRIWVFIGFPPHLSTIFRYELDMFILRIICFLSLGYRSQIRRLRRLSDLKIHLGCGNIVKLNWLNVDCYPPPKKKLASETEILVLDVRKGLPLSEGSAKSIYSEHFFEHIPLSIVREVILPNCFELLDTGGVIRIGVPDGETLLSGYSSDNKKEENPHFVNLKEGQTKMMRCNDLVTGNQHLFLYDFETFEFILKEAGFISIKKSGSNESEEVDFKNVDSTDSYRKATTLYIEAKKP